MSAKKEYSPGLEGIIAAETSISYLDVEQEQIVIRGYDLIELAENRHFLDVAYLLLYGSLPDAAEKESFHHRLYQQLELPEVLTTSFSLFPASMSAMDMLRTGISLLAGSETNMHDLSAEANQKKAVNLLGAIPAIMAGSYRTQQNESLVSPDPSMSFSANMLYMLTGKKPGVLETEVFDQSLVAYIEHEMPNSTFAARVIASTQADMYGAFTGAVASLKGPLHGGANEAVMHLLLEAGTPDGVERLFREKLANKERIMGFGHRVYMKKMDPRAQLMKKSLHRLAEKQDRMDLYDMCVRGEELIAEEKGLHPNLDYYAAPVYYLLGIPIDLYTPIFFASRAAGLGAHVIEQHSNNRLFRPRVDYTGPRGITLT
ncbi:citrate synthase [Marinococcus halophilus]|uniref:citrate synthase n=1 Tax=Marinococcus halophilus TaxID=1371 RepID=UPI0009A8A87D|nr:citrate synthase [Marinococcus halophilus]